MVTETIASEGIRRIADKRIFWGHQSVGGNIIAGIQEVVGEARSPGLNIQNTSLESQLNRPVFAHQRVGRNMDPVSKMSAFETLLKGGVGKTCDIAGLKFCYVDVGAKTDVEALFKHYLKFSERVRHLYPDLKLIHFTVPLTSRQRGMKAWIKKLMGRPLRGVEDNIQRNRFNELMRRRYRNPTVLFDLAAIESSSPESGREFFMVNDKKYYSLVPAFTDDGGHLNRAGRRWVAVKFLSFLAAQ